MKSSPNTPSLCHPRMGLSRQSPRVLCCAQGKNATLRGEGYGLASIVLEELICEKCYNEGDVYCATVESVSEGQEDEPRWLPDDRRERMHALRPTILMGEMCVSREAQRRRRYCVGRRCPTHPGGAGWTMEGGAPLPHQQILGSALSTPAKSRGPNASAYANARRPKLA